MLEYLHVILVSVSISVLVILLMFLVWKWCCFKQSKDFLQPNQTRIVNLQSGIAQLHHQERVYHHHRLDLSSKRIGNYYGFRRGGGGVAAAAKPLFNWGDYPSLVTDAVENGWSRFAFTNYVMSSSSSPSSLLGLCAVVGDRESETEITWEVWQGSADFMQKIRLNSGLRKVQVTNSSTVSAASVIKTALPLPGPSLAFPQEAYFEITILYSRTDHDDSSIGKVKEGERTKLINQENPYASTNSESLVHVPSSHRIIQIDELKLASNNHGEGGSVILSVGLTAGGALPLRLPGSYHGSIGFNSNGSVFLDGIKLVLESEKAEWGRKDKVIGCGFDPKQKKVFFTVDSELIHVINCKSEEFGTPLYPTLAANNDVLVLVNFGQSAFTYAPANAQRTPNPCFIGNSPAAATAALGYEDSKELFSMGRIDSQWLNRTSNKGGINNRTMEFDEEGSEADLSEADLFEIALDSSGKSPNTVL